VSDSDAENDENPEVPRRRPRRAVRHHRVAEGGAARGSYTASLFTHEKGENAVLEKIGEESTETILAAKDDDLDELTYESADLVYHLLVLFAMKDLDLDDLREELRDRF